MLNWHPSLWGIGIRVLASEMVLAPKWLQMASEMQNWHPRLASEIGTRVVSRYAFGTLVRVHVVLHASTFHFVTLWHSTHALAQAIPFGKHPDRHLFGVGARLLAHWHGLRALRHSSRGRRQRK